MHDGGALRIDQVTHQYGNERLALDGLSLAVAPGELYALLGPNGSGKSTLFRLISTIMPLQKGSISVFGFDATREQEAVRRHLGVVFQNPALDKQLTVSENLACHGHLYGLRGAKLEQRIRLLLERFRISSRANERVLKLSGGMRRRVELAKALIPEPKLLLLDEPSTGLDVSSRIDLWTLLEEMRRESQVTIVLTTHLMDEADRCNHVAIIDQGKLLASGSPNELKSRVGGDVISFTGPEPDQLASAVQEKLGVAVQRLDRMLRIERPEAHLFLPQLIEAVPGMIDSVSIGRPTLDDVFVHITGRRLETNSAESPPPHQPSSPAQKASR